MRKINIYWVITILAITGVFAWQLVALAGLYRFDKENFKGKVNDNVYTTTFKMNALMSDKPCEDNFVGIDAATSRIVYCHGHVRDTIAYDPTIKLMDVSNRAMYDIHASLWSLERLDSLFQEQSKKILGYVPIYYCLTDSTGKALQVYGRKELSSGIQGKPIPLGFRAKHELQYYYVYPPRAFINGEIQSILLFLFLFFAIVASLVVLLQSIRQSKTEARYRDMVLGTIIHNLRTPIDNMTEATLLEHEELKNIIDPSDEELFERMLDELRIMNETTTRLLHLNSSLYGVKIRARDTDLPDLLQRVVSRYQRGISRGKVVNFFTDFKMKNNIIQLDSNYFSGIAQNLIDNSIKYSGEEVQITISIEENGKKVIIRFADNGYGMSKMFVKHAFKPYSRQCDENMIKKDGYGLGLFFVKQTVKAHGGTIKLSSTVGIGTEFIITLPRESKYYVTED